LTADAVLRELRTEHGISLRLGGRCPGGEVGAHYADDEDGRRFVFKWSTDLGDADRLALVVSRVNAMRAIGYPAPEHLPPLAIRGGIVVLQVAVDGEWHDDVDLDLAGEVLRLNEIQRGHSDGAGDWTEHIRTTLTQGADGYCLHDPLRRHSLATRRLLDWIEDVGRNLAVELPSSDLVHYDFHHRNMLRDGSSLVAVVDWEGCRPGDRAFDLVTFCFGVTHARAAAGVEEQVWRQASELAEPDRLAAYVAHMSLRRVDWSIRHHPGEVDDLLELVARYRQAVA
jgi:hypothetical protein